MRLDSLLNARQLTKIVTLFVALTAMTGTAWAETAPLCAEIFAFTQSPEGRVVKHLGAPTPYSAQQIELHLASIDRLLLGLAVPKETQVTIGAGFTRSSFDRADFKLYTGMRTEIYPSGKTYSPGKNLAILSHEYGHAILEKNFMVNLEAYRKIKPDFLVVELARQVTVNLEKKLKDLRYRQDVTFNQERKQALEKEIAETSAKIEALTRDRLRAVTVYTVSSALHEFFADSVALVRHKDPEAIKDIVQDYKTDPAPGSYPDLLRREFDVNHRDLREKQWAKLLPWATFTNDVYFMLLPARWELWQIVKTHIDSPNYQEQVLAKVYKAVENVLAEALSWSPSEMTGVKLSPVQAKKLNTRLIEELHKSLQ